MNYFLKDHMNLFYNCILEFSCSVFNMRFFFLRFSFSLFIMECMEEFL